MGHALVRGNFGARKTEYAHDLFTRRALGFVARLDADVGKLAAQLKQSGQDENTILFFASDNGPLRGIKRGL